MNFEEDLDAPFAIDNLMISPFRIEDLEVEFQFDLQEYETIHDIFLKSKQPHEIGYLYGNEKLLLTYPNEFNYACALFDLNPQKYNAYSKMTGQDLCSNCQCDKSKEKVFYYPLSSDPLFRVVIKVWSSQYKHFCVKFVFSEPPSKDDLKLYVQKIIKMAADAEKKI